MTVSDGYNDPQFDAAISGFHTPTYQAPAVDPYGTNPHIPAHSIPHKPGLTKRGKAVFAIGSLVLAGGGLITWQHHADTAAANALKAKELQIQQDKLALEQQKAATQANQAAQKTQTEAEKARQAKIDACVKDNKTLVGKQLGQTLSGVISDCQNQYPATTEGTAMQEAASATDTGSSGGGGTEGLLVGAGFLLVGGMWIGLRRASRPQPAPAAYPPPYYPHN